MKLNKQGLVFIFCAGALWPQVKDTMNDSLRTDSLSILETETWQQDSVQKFNPFISGTASLILPGLGQVYTRHYVKAGFFVALEASLALMTNFWRQTAVLRDAEEKKWTTRAESDTGFNKAKDREESYLSRHGAVDARLSMYSFFAWTAGGYVFNVLDAVGSSNVFRNSKPKSPGTAALLAAIPGLGLGQWYNGSISKAGMVMMGQISLGLMAYNSQRLMKRAENNYLRLTDPDADTLTKQVAMAYSGYTTYPLMWSSTRSRAFINRNMYLWYSVFFYGYSVFDAVVDAYLHEYSEKMKIKPDLVIGNRQVFLTLQTTF
jgi:hypothetical protein